MDDKLLLRQSIEIWGKRTVATSYDEIKDMGSNTCPLCVAHRTTNSDGDRTCNACPVAAFVGEEHCEGTPYYDVMRARSTWWFKKFHKREAMGAVAEFQEQAQREVDFLKKVLDNITEEDAE